jgi:hypothetical protein
MTDIKNVLSLTEDQPFKILLTDAGRKLYFDKECLEKITILRRVNEGEWITIGKEVRAPFLDIDEIPTPAEITYKILFGHSKNTDHVVKVYLPAE